MVRKASSKRTLAVVGKTGTASPNSDQESLDDERGIMPAITSWLG
jgi:hypothetical protein